MRLWVTFEMWNLLVNLRTFFSYTFVNVDVNLITFVTKYSNYFKYRSALQWTVYISSFFIKCRTKSNLERLHNHVVFSVQVCEKLRPTTSLIVNKAASQFGGHHSESLLGTVTSVLLNFSFQCMLVCHSGYSHTCTP